MRINKKFIYIFTILLISSFFYACGMFPGGHGFTGTIITQIQFPENNGLQIKLIKPETKKIYVIVYGKEIPINKPIISDPLTPDNPRTRIKGIPLGTQKVIAVAFGDKQILTADKVQIEVVGGINVVSLDLKEDLNLVFSKNELALLEKLLIEDFITQELVKARDSGNDIDELPSITFGFNKAVAGEKEKSLLSNIKPAKDESTPENEEVPLEFPQPLLSSVPLPKISAAPVSISVPLPNSSPIVEFIGGGTTIITPPVITAFNPASGGAGREITITGTDFGATPTVKFNGITAEIVSSSASQIIAKVPQNATTGPIVVICSNGGSITTINFTVISDGVGSTVQITDGVNTANTGTITGVND